MMEGAKQINLVRKFSRRIFCLSFLCITGLIIAGCGLTQYQKEGISSFGRAASALGETSSEQFVTFRNDTIRMNKMRLALEGKKLSPVTPDGKPADRDYFQRDLNFDSGLDPDNIKTRINAANLLSTYGDLLVAFSEETHEKDLRDASDKFAASLKSFPDNPLPKDEIEGLGKLVQMAGSAWIEMKKKRVIKEIVPKVSPLIQRICDNLEKDFDIKKKGVANNVFLVQDRLASESIDGLKKDTASINDRLVQIEGFELATDYKAKLDLASDKVLNAVSVMRKADEELVQVINNKSVSIDDIKLFYKNAKELVDSLKVFVK